MLILLAALFLSPGILEDVPVDLDARLAAYWERVGAGDREGAAELVREADRRMFLKRALLPVTRWKEVARRAQENNEVLVVISVGLNQPGPGPSIPVRVSQKWVLEEAQWWLDVPEGSAAEINRLLYGP
jgi:hypothetical protein